MIKVIKHTNAAGYEFDIPMPHSENFCGPMCRVFLDYVYELYEEGFLLELELNALQRAILLASARFALNLNVSS